MSVHFLCLAISLLLFLPYQKGLRRIYSKCLSRSLPEPRRAVSNRDFLSRSKIQLSTSTRFLSSEQTQTSIACPVLLVVMAAAAALLCICIAAPWCTFPGSCDPKGSKPTAFPCPGNLTALYSTEPIGNVETLFVLVMGRDLVQFFFYKRVN